MSLDFEPFQLADGTPNPDAMLTCATLVSALYHGDRRPFEQVAELTGTQLALFEHDPASFQPDVAVLVKLNWALVVFDGTTNVSQWFSHLASAFFPLLDEQTGNTAVGSFLLGLRLIEQRVLNAIFPALAGNVFITGHSYGAGAGKLFADHVALRQPPPATLQLMTFGEPKSSGNFLGNSPNYLHFRIVARITARTPFIEGYGYDPVTFCPPGAMTCYKWPLLTTIPLGLLGFKWKWFGQAYTIDDERLQRTMAYEQFRVTFDLTGWLMVGENYPFAYTHLMDQSYLTKTLALWRRFNQIP